MMPSNPPVRMVLVKSPGTATTGGPNYEYTGEDRSQNIVVKFWLDRETAVATNELLRENGPMHVVVRHHQVMGAWPIVRV